MTSGRTTDQARIREPLTGTRAPSPMVHPCAIVRTIAHGGFVNLVKRPKKRAQSFFTARGLS